MSQAVLNHILDAKVIAITRGVSSEDIPALAQALYDGGITCMEITFDMSSEEKSKDTLKGISIIRDQFAGKIIPGAGTVMTPEQVRAAAEAGAEYMISPNSDEEVIRETKRLDKVSIPGALTPSEAANAHKWGADIVKIFPAGNLGPSYIKAICAPLKHIKFTAVGGVTAENCASFVKAGCVGVSAGGNLVNAKLIAEKNFAEITRIARAYVDALKDL